MQKKKKGKVKSDWALIQGVRVCVCMGVQGNVCAFYVCEGRKMADYSSQGFAFVQISPSSAIPVNNYQSSDSVMLAQ